MQLVKTLSVLAIAGFGGQALQALDIKDETLKLGIVCNLQTRAEISQADNAIGDEYDVSGGVNGKSDTADFYVRRFRPGFKGTYMDSWKFGVIFRADDAGRSSTSNSVTVHQGWAGKEIKGDGITHLIKGGLDYAFFNQAEVSNSTSLLLNQRADSQLLGVRGVGIGYMLTSEMVHFGVDIQNNKNDTTGASQVGDDAEGEGLCYTARIEITGPGELSIPKWQESFAGAEGTGFLLGLEYGLNQADRGTGGNTNSQDTSVIGADLLVHWNFLSALLTFRTQTLSQDNDTGASPDDIKSQIIGMQVGWAIPTDMATFEPAVRYQILDYNTDDDNEASVFGGRDYSTGSGNQLDIGVNMYLAGHSNKLQLAYTDWKAEDGDGKASIFRLQHSLNF